MTTPNASNGMDNDLIETYLRLVEALRVLAKDPETDQTFYEMLFKGSCANAQPHELPNNARDIEIKKFLGYGQNTNAEFETPEDWAKWKKAADNWYNLRCKIEECSKLSREMAMENKGYPDFSMIHLWLEALWLEMRGRNIIWD